VNIPLDDLLFAAFLVPLLAALLLVEAVEAFFVAARLVVLLAAPRFFVEALAVFLLAAFLVPFLAPREAVDFFADRVLLAFLAVDLLRAFVVGILSSGNAQQGLDFLWNHRSSGASIGARSPGSRFLDRQTDSFCHKATPLHC
jgi:hypothetical protein